MGYKYENVRMIWQIEIFNHWISNIRFRLFKGISLLALILPEILIQTFGQLP